MFQGSRVWGVCRLLGCSHGGGGECQNGRGGVGRILILGCGRWGGSDFERGQTAAVGRERETHCHCLILWLYRCLLESSRRRIGGRRRGRGGRPAASCLGNTHELQAPRGKYNRSNDSDLGARFAALITAHQLHLCEMKTSRTSPYWVGSAVVASTARASCVGIFLSRSIEILGLGVFWIRLFNSMRVWL